MKATPAGRLYYQLQPSVPRTEGKGSSSWPTPTSSTATMADMIQAKWAGNDPKRPTYQGAKAWPTPHANCHTGAGMHGDGGPNGQDVADSEGGGFHNRNDSPYVGEANRKINSSDNSSDFGRKGEALADTERAGSEKRNTSAFAEEPRPYSGALGAIGGDWTTQSGLGRGSDGPADWLDGTRWPAAFGEPQHDWEPPRVAVGVKNRVPRLKALGNAVVPQQVYPILRAIREVHERGRER